MPFIAAKRFGRIRRAIRTLGTEFDRAWASGLLDDSGERLIDDAEDDDEDQEQKKKPRKLHSPKEKLEAEETVEQDVTKSVNKRGDDSSLDNKTEAVHKLRSIAIFCKKFTGF